MTPATSGPALPEPSAFYDPEACCWRTSQGTFPWDSTPSSVTLPRWGTTRGGVLYALPTPELPTDAPACSSSAKKAQNPTVAENLPLLPTPAVNDMGAAYTPDEWDAWTARMQEKHGNGNGHGKSLEIEAQRLLPTPVADHSRGLPQPGTDYASLPNAVIALMPTPTAMDPVGSRGHKPDGTAYGPTSGTTLTDAVLLPTPNTHNAKESGRPRDHRADMTAALSLRHGASTPPPSTAGNESSDDQLPGQLSLDDAASD